MSDRKPSTYELSLQAPFMHPDYYPLEQHLPADRYRPIAPWLGRLILPAAEERLAVRGACFELYLTPEEHADLRGKVVRLRFSLHPEVQKRAYTATKTIILNEQALKGVEQGRAHPYRVNHWQYVNPLESLAGARKIDDMIVYLIGTVTVDPDDDGTPCLYIEREPVLVSGRYYALVTFIQPTTATGDRWQVRHFNRETRQFDGPEEEVSMPPIKPMSHGVYLSTTNKLQESPVNPDGWYIYGAQDKAGVFTVQALAPRALLRVQPQQVVLGRKQTQHFLRKELWQDTEQQKGQIGSVLLTQAESETAALQDWQVGDQALLIHVYGAIGGEMTEPPAKTPIYFGHFAYGTATVIHEPLADEPIFDIVYHQVYAHNGDGLISGNHSYAHYMGDRQRGWLGSRPIADLLIRLDSLTNPFEIYGETYSGLRGLSLGLDVMMARYRIGDGNGFTSVEITNNCAQDANQVLYAVIREFESRIHSFPPLQQWLDQHPADKARFDDLASLTRDLRRTLLPLGVARDDWKYGIENLGSSQGNSPLVQIPTAIASWRTMMPPIAQRAVATDMVKHGASVWVLRSNQVGGYDPRIAPRAPTHF